MNILVSGVASDVGFGIARILRDWEITSNLIGVDIKDDHPGTFVCDICERSPLPGGGENYMSWLENFIKSKAIDLFIPTSDAEIRYLSNQDLSGLSDTNILINERNVVQTSLDKYQCMKYLSSEGIRVPKHGLIKKNDKVSSEWYESELFPVVLKPRFGQGSKGFRKIRSKEEFPEFDHENFIWQELLADDDQEFTCAAYSPDKIEKQILIIKRTLDGGVTGSGEIVDNSEILEYISSIMDAFQLKGVMNVQLRLTKDGPVLFEINPRLSSTVVFRDKLGFTDLKWWINDLTSSNKNIYCQPEVGTKFYRKTHEYIITND